MSDLKMYDVHEVDTILCVWDAMIVERNEREPHGKFTRQLNSYWDNHGIAQMRIVASEIGEQFEQVWNRLKAEWPDDEYDSPAWDIVVVPQLLRHVQFDAQRYVIPTVIQLKQAARTIYENEWNAWDKRTWHSTMRAYAKVTYADDGSVFDEEQMERLRQSGMKPEEAVLHIGEKYDLLRADTFG